MGTTIQETANLNYTDSSGKYREGMKKDEARDIRYAGGIFTENDAIKEFQKIDKDMDGVLSHDEISDDLREENDLTRKAGLTALGMSALLGFISHRAKKAGKSTTKTVTLLLGCYYMALAAKDLYKISRNNTRIAQGHN